MSHPGPEPSDAPRARVVLVTAPDAEIGVELARSLVSEGLVACVNVVEGVRSIYRWEGRLQDDREVLLVLKTRAERCRALAARVKDLHPYDLPEVLVLPVVDGSPEYLDWILAESSGEEGAPVDPAATPRPD